MCSNNTAQTQTKMKHTLFLQTPTFVYSHSFDQQCKCLSLQVSALMFHPQESVLRTAENLLSAAKVDMSVCISHNKKYTLRDKHLRFMDQIKIP